MTIQTCAISSAQRSFRFDRNFTMKLFVDLFIEAVKVRHFVEPPSCRALARKAWCLREM